MCKKHLDIPIKPIEVMKDLYSSTKFGPLFYSRNILEYINRSMLFFRLQLFSRLILYYIILCQLELTSFIKIDAIFNFIDYILDNLIKLCGFKAK